MAQPVLSPRRRAKNVLTIQRRLARVPCAVRFSLSKWYLDVIADDGALAIGYAARMTLGPLVVHYASLLACDPSGTVTTKTSLRRSEPPRTEGSRVSWSAPALGVSATFRALEPSVHETLLDRDDGQVEWTCHAPRAEVEARVDGRPLRGLGYAEHLALGIAPWRLPIRELSWGRALAGNDSLVWIDWRGDDYKTQFAIARGERLGRFSVDVDGVRDADDHPLVTLDDHTTLREGAIGKTALAVLGRDVLERVPGKALLLDEHKWRSRAEFASGERGFAIHETVRWP